MLHIPRDATVVVRRRRSVQVGGAQQSPRQRQLTARAGLPCGCHTNHPM